LQDFLYSSGDYLVLAYPDALINVSELTGFTEEIVNRGTGTIFKKEFRYSFDNETFSEFLELSSVGLESVSLPEGSVTWFQFRYTLLSGGPAMVKSVALQYTTYPVDSTQGYVAPNKEDESKVYAFPITYVSGAKWDPYKLNRATRLYKDLNLMVNSLFGWEIQYYRVLPQGRSKDVFLMEYSLYEHEPMQCMKVVVPNNQFPDNKLSMGPFGVDFELPFEIQIDKDYFQAIYGDGAGPQKRDVIYFPRTNRIYEVSSSYLFRDFMNEPLYFKMTLIKWLPKSNVESSSEILDLESIIPSVDSFFGDEQVKERIDDANPEQFQQTTLVSDPVRSYLDPNVMILENPLMNYYLQVAEYQYDLSATLSDSTIKILVDHSSLTEGKTYYVRFSRTSSQPNEDYYSSMKTLLYKGLDQSGNAIFIVLGGNSSLTRDYSKGTVFQPGSEFYVYENEYDPANTSETPLFSCATTTYAQTHQESFVEYLAEGYFEATDDRSYSAWFNIKKNQRFSSPVVSSTYDASTLSLTVDYKLPHDFLVGDYISLRRISGGNFNLVGQVTQVLDRKHVVINFSFDMVSYISKVFPNWTSYTDLTLQQTYPRVFIDDTQNGKGIKIDLLEKRYFRVFSNENVYYFILPNTQNELSEGTWYSICVSFSNLFSQLTLNVWQMRWNPTTNTPATSDLSLVYGKVVNNFPRVDRTSRSNYFITPSDMLLTNIRVWIQKIETDKQPLVLNQSIVKDASKAVVIDNAIPPSRLPYISYTH